MNKPAVATTNSFGLQLQSLGEDTIDLQNLTAQEVITKRNTYRCKSYEVNIKRKKETKKMGSPIIARLAADASPFKAGESTKFYCRAGVKYYNPESKQQEWSNYSFVLWASNQGQVDYYSKMLKKGNLVHVAAKALVAKVNSDEQGKIWPYIEGVQCQLVSVYELKEREQNQN